MLLYARELTGTKSVSKGLKNGVELVLALEGTATRDNTGSRAEVGARGDNELLVDKLGGG